jgi:hypothetical protein
MFRENPSASVGFTLAASAIYAARFGACEPEHRADAQWGEIARALKQKYGETLTAEEAIQEMKS